jgi:hypothetical protein
MRKQFFLFLLLAASVGSFAQTQVNDPNAEARDLKGFHGVSVSSGIQLLLSQGNTEAVAISASQAEHKQYVKTEVKNGILRIYFDNENGKRIRNRNIKAYVSIVNIDMIDVSAGATVKADNGLKADKLELDASSGATFSGKIEAKEVTVDQSSGAVVNISGSVANLKVDGSSGSIFHGFDLAADNCDASVSSGSNIQVTVNKELSVDASSGGNISYKGNGVIRNVHTSSGGNVSKKSK